MNLLSRIFRRGPAFDPRAVTIAEARWKIYTDWRDAQVCEGCGKRFADRPRDAEGRCTDVWITEYRCAACFAPSLGP